MDAKVVADKIVDAVIDTLKLMVRIVEAFGDAAAREAAFAGKSLRKIVWACALVVFAGMSTLLPSATDDVSVKVKGSAKEAEDLLNGLSMDLADEEIDFALAELRKDDPQLSRETLIRHALTGMKMELDELVKEEKEGTPKSDIIPVDESEFLRVENQLSVESD